MTQSSETTPRKRCRAMTPEQKAARKAQTDAERKAASWASAQRLAAEAPPLTTEQQDKLVLLLGPGLGRPRYVSPEDELLGAELIAGLRDDQDDVAFAESLR